MIQRNQRLSSTTNSYHFHFCNPAISVHSLSIDAFVKSVITSWKLKTTCLAEVEARFDLIERAEEAMP